MKKIFHLLIAVLLFSSGSFAQTLFNQAAVTVQTGAVLYVGGETQLSAGGTIGNSGTIYQAGNWTNNNTAVALDPASGTVIFWGTGGAYTIGGTQKTGFFNMQMNTGQALTTQFITVYNNLNFVAGMLYANQNAQLEPTATVTGEANGRYAAGFLQSTRTINNTTQTFGGMGVTVATTNTLGSVQVIRQAGTTPAPASQATNIPSAYTQSIQRTWTFNAQTPAASNLTFNWLSDNDNLVTIADAQLYRTDNGGTSWNAIGTAADLSARSVTTNGATIFTKYTVGENTLTTKRIQYLTSSLTENLTNNGSIGGSITINLFGTETFPAGIANGSTFPAGAFTPSNVPAGLTPILTKISPNQAVLTFTGNATAHRTPNNVNNVGIQFNASAFASNSAVGIAGITKNDLAINFVQNNLQITGTGVAVSPDGRLDFGAIPLNGQPEFTLTIKNIGLTSPTIPNPFISSIAGLSPLDFEIVPPTGLPTVLNPNDEITFKIKLRANSPFGSRSGTFTIPIPNEPLTLSPNFAVVEPPAVPPSPPLPSGGTLVVNINGTPTTLINRQTVTVPGDFPFGQPIPIGLLISQMTGGNFGQGGSGISFTPSQLGSQDITFTDRSGNVFTIKINVVRQTPVLTAGSLRPTPTRRWTDADFIPDFGLSGLDFEIAEPALSGASKTADGRIKLGRFVGNVRLRVFYPATATSNKSNEVEYTFAVGKALQTITYPEITSKKVGDPDFNLNIGSATSGDPLEYEIVSGSNLVQLINGQLKFLGMGQVTLRIRQRGNDFYEPTEITRIFNIGRGSQIITFPAIPNQNMGANAGGLTIVLGASSSAGLPIRYELNPSNAGTISGNILTLTGSGDVEVIAYQEGNNSYEAATAVRRTFGVAGYLEITDVSVTDDGDYMTIKYRENGTFNYFDNRFSLFLSDENGVFGTEPIATGWITRGEVRIGIPYNTRVSNKYQVKIRYRLPFIESNTRAVTVTLYPKPPSPFNFEQKENTFCVSRLSSAQSSNNSVNSDPYFNWNVPADLNVSYQVIWYFNNVEVLTTDNKVCVNLDELRKGAAVASLESVRAYIKMGTRKGALSSPYFVKKPVANESDWLKNDLQVYPNPSKDRIWVEVKEQISTDWTLRIYNSVGAIVGEYKTKGSSFKMEIDLSNQSKGVYLIDLQADGKRAARRIIKQ